jgi:rieske iron-sulfur protein
MICRDARASWPARRTILQGAAGLVVAWMTPVSSLAQDARSARPAVDDVLVKTTDTTLTPLTPADIPLAGTPVIAWAMSASDRTVRNGSRLNRVLLVRLDHEALADKTRAQAASGVVAYSAICTHSGCDVGTLLSKEQLLFCECHESKFDPKDNARVTDGPAPRSLPALPLKIVDGRLVVAAPFTSRVGFENG